jgi:hypothetical protein
MKMKTLKKSAIFIIRLLVIAEKFSVNSAEILCRFGRNLAGIWLQEGYKRANKVSGNGIMIIQIVNFTVNGMRGKRIEDKEGMADRLFRKARSPPRQRGKEQQKSF